MAVKKLGGKFKNGRTSISKRLGVKKFHNEIVKPGAIIVRQRGSVFHLGDNAFYGKDYTIHSKVFGKVCFKTKYSNLTKYSVVSVISCEN